MVSSKKSADFFQCLMQRVIFTGLFSNFVSYFWIWQYNWCPWVWISVHLFWLGWDEILESEILHLSSYLGVFPAPILLFCNFYYFFYKTAISHTSDVVTTLCQFLKLFIFPHPPSPLCCLDWVISLDPFSDSLTLPGVVSILQINRANFFISVILFFSLEFYLLLS